MARQPGFSALLVIVSIAALAAQGAPECGDLYAEPFAPDTDKGPRPCVQVTAPQYTPRYSGLAYRVLQQESACAVPDGAYQLLDRIVDAAKARHASLGGQISKDTLAMIGDVLADHGFALHIPTDTMGDALFNRARGPAPERHIFDCDTGGVLYITLAEHLGMPLSLVDIWLANGLGHNYVRWINPQGRTVDWDVNGRCECSTPRRPLLPHHGKAMTEAQVMGYFKGVDAVLLGRQGKYADALTGYREAGKLYGESTSILNNLAWLIATKPVPDRPALKQEALAAAERAVAVVRTANYLDTLACAYAMNGRFADALAVEREALQAKQDPDFTKRLTLFEAGKDCLGER